MVSIPNSFRFVGVVVVGRLELQFEPDLDPYCTECFV
jgi:hypothetical protein